jgi:hypothetical protein
MDHLIAYVDLTPWLQVYWFYNGQIVTAAKLANQEITDWIYLEH